MSETTQKVTLLYKLLVSPSYRFLRHVLLLVGIAAISLSQTAYSFSGKSALLGNWIYLIASVTFIAYLAVGYTHMYVLVPRLLLRKKYLVYLLLSSLSVVLLVLLKPLQEYLINDYFHLPHARTHYWGIVSLLDILSDFVLVLLCITGISMSVLLRNWLVESRRKSELEKKSLQTQVDAMKQQVNPEILFHTLHHTAQLAVSDPDKAAATVLQLSQLLRYGLYDGTREKVLLSAEVAFLKNYMRLEQFTDDFFDYEITAAPATFRTLVPPLIFTPILQEVLRKMPHTTPKPLLEAVFDENEQALVLTIRYDGPIDGTVKALTPILSRNEQHYGKRVTMAYPETVSARTTLVIHFTDMKS